MVQRGPDAEELDGEGAVFGGGHPGRVRQVGQLRGGRRGLARGRSLEQQTDNGSEVPGVVGPAGVGRQVSVVQEKRETVGAVERCGLVENMPLAGSPVSITPVGGRRTPRA